MNHIQYQEKSIYKSLSSSHLSLLVCLIFLALIIWLRWLFAVYELSTLPSWSANDGPYIMVAVVEWLNGGGFNNSLTNFYTEPHWRDGQHSLVAYPPVHMLLLATLTTTPDVAGVYKAIWLIEAIGLILLCAALIALIYRTGQQHRLGIWFLVLLGLACAGTLGFSGRPDTTFVTILSLGCLYAVLTPKPNAIIVGMLLGLLGAIQPTAALLIASCIAIWFSFLWAGIEAGKQLVIVAVSSVALLLLALGTYYDIGDVVQAIGRNTPQQVFGYFTLPLFLQTQFLDYLRPLSGGVLVIGIFSFLILLLKQQFESTVFLLLGLAALLIFSTHAFVVRPHCTYNSQALLPVLLLVTLLAAAISKKYCIFSCVVLSLPALALPLQSLLLHDHVNRGVTLRSAQAIYEQIIPNLPSDSLLGIDTHLWPLSRDGRDWNRSYHFNWDGPRMQSTKDAVLFVREGSYLTRGSSLISASPASIVDHSRQIDHRLWLDCNTKQLLNVLGRHIYTPVMGYAFSVYIPKSWDDPCSSKSTCAKQVEYITDCNLMLAD